MDRKYWFCIGFLVRTAQPEMMQGKKGTFALRSPHRPNPIGAAVIPIESIDEGVIKVRGLDCLDGTPLVDIKPAIYFEA